MAGRRIDLAKRTLMSSLTTPASKGLEGIVATTSSICYIDGDRGVLAYRGIDIHELADNSNFEETCYLLWFGKLPTRRELRELHERLAEERKLDAVSYTHLGTGGTQRLSRLVGKSKAIELMVTGNTFSFEEAQELGIINDIYERDGFMENMIEYAKQFCPPNKAAKAVGRIKRAVQTLSLIHISRG